MPLSDVVFLNGNSPEDVANSPEPYSLGTWFHAKNMDLIPLSKLGELLGVATYKDLVSGFRPLFPPEGDSFVLSFPEELQDKIRSLTDDEISDVVSGWADIEEFGGFATTESLATYLKSLREFLNANSGYAALHLSV
jgi:hypothetical protein